MSFNHVKLLLIFLLSSFLVSCKPNLKQLFTSAEQYFRRGEYARAIDAYNQVLIQDSLNQLAFFQRGRCYSFLGRNREAVIDFNRVISLQPPSDGQIEFRWDRNSPFAPEEERYKVYYEEAAFERAIAEYEMDSSRRAFKDFQRCFELGYEKTACKRYIGCIYIAFKKKEEGCTLLKEAMLAGDTTSYNLLHQYCY